jgi:uncharacterized membrane protein
VHPLPTATNATSDIPIELVKAAPESSEIRDAEGFRRRGKEVTRLMAFVDAAFAFSLTLLVISFDEIPKNVDELLLAMKGIPAFLAAFALLARIWLIHSRYCWRFGLEDSTVITLSLSLVALVLVYIYPLRIMFSTAVSFVTQGWVPWTFKVNSMHQLTQMYLIYGVAWVLIAFLLLLLHLHAWRLRHILRLDAREQIQVRLDCAGYAFMAIIGLISIALASQLRYASQPWMLGLPGLVYFLMFLQWPIDGWLRRRWSTALIG